MTVKAVFFDLSGVLYDGDRTLAGAREAIAEARRRQLTLRFVTNTATKSRRQILTKLDGMDLAVNAEELFTAPDAALGYIQHHRLTPYALVHSAIEPLFGEPPARANCVVVGDAREGLNYPSLNRAFRLLMDGCPLLGIGDNRYFRDSDGLSLDAGPFIHALAYAADTKPLIMGKPSADFFQQVVASADCAADECLMIGDDVRGDVLGALDAGLQAVLVCTGKYQPGDEQVPGREIVTIDSVAKIGDLL